MSTRCQIHVKGHNASVYRHSDGYPDSDAGVLKMLCPLVKSFMQHRGWDPEYMTAHIAHACIEVNRETHASLRETYEKGGMDVSRLDDFIYLGVGVEGFTGTFHGDLEYIYIVHEDHIEVRRTAEGFWDEATLEHTELVYRVNFDGKTLPKLKSPGKKRAKETQTT